MSIPESVIEAADFAINHPNQLRERVRRTLRALAEGMPEDALDAGAKTIFLETNYIMENCDERWRSERLVRGQRWLDIARAAIADFLVHVAGDT